MAGPTPDRALHRPLRSRGRVRLAARRHV